MNAMPAPHGLSSSEAAERLLRYGRNQLRLHRERALLVQFLLRFRNPLVIVLLAASLVTALTGDAAGAAIIGAIVLMSITLDFVQEYRAGRAAERLAQQVAVTATVLRDGMPHEVPVAEIVPGDVVRLSAGDLVPADGRVLDARDFFVNQAQLTGEPYPVEKHAATGAAESAEDEAAVFMGSSVVSGTATILIERTGPATELGKIADSLDRSPPPTAFERGTRHFGMLIMRLTMLLVLFTLLVNLAFARPLLESFLFAVALAVGLTPELLPMVVSVTLARGAQRMAARRVIVKRLSAIQDLGSMDVLCTDKTGTLTEAKIRLERHIDATGRPSQRVLELAYLNSFFESGLKSPLDEAILAHGEIDLVGWRKIDEVPFDFERRRVSVLAEKDGGRILVVKGAPEDILALSTAYETAAGAILPLDDAARERIVAVFAGLGDEGFRALGIAWRAVAPDHPHAVVSDETELVFAGFAAFLDPPKESAAIAVAHLGQSGVAVKILTGDNERVTRHVCTTLAIPIAGVLTGQEIAMMDDAALAARVDEVNLFCRVTPAQKNRILLALKSRGHAVGYLGDGINDAPSLNTADVGISVDGAVDVAREAADLVLLEHDLDVLHDGIREGRRTFGNVMKYIMMATSSNFGNMFSMAAATLFLPFLPMLPMQILLNNLLYDISEIPLPLDNVDTEDMARPRRWDMRFIRDFMLTIGPVSSLFDFFTFYLLIAVLEANEMLFRTGWFVESIATQVLVIFVIRTRRNPLRSFPHPALALTSLAVVVIALLLPFTPLAGLLGFTPLPPLFFLLLVGLLIAYLGLVEASKRRFFHRAGMA
ncbi:magnesium-translocating P-type ATPase [Sulfuricystis thermophila]|uniref:magnesium-translocating P-type ATPase n=1 Tax=Sulfuricystis thermophila TaxID=2496847 RepID=UPI001035CFCF|nr:magnesium-translocating P-type ATPase [Sulfuricystis thermophila]